MNLKEAFQKFEETNAKVEDLAKQGLLDEVEIASVTAEYKKITESLADCQTRFIQEVLITNMTVKMQNLFFDSIHKIDKDAPKQ